MRDFRIVETWVESDLSSLPDHETDRYEYKSSKIANNKEWQSELQRKLRTSASAFWNSGGGIFVVGVDDTGQIDGGIPPQIGRQNIRDWADQVLHQVEPPGPYAIRVIEPSLSSMSINSGRIILVVAFGESSNLPHMSDDKVHYVRLGSHNLACSQYLLEAIRARRGIHEPLLKGVLRRHDQRTGVIELVVLSANQQPAFAVEIDFDPLPVFLAKSKHGLNLPLTIPVINTEFAFRMDMYTINTQDVWFGDQPINLILRYKDVAGRHYSDVQVVDSRSGLSGFSMNHVSHDDPERAIGNIAKDIKKIREILERWK